MSRSGARDERDESPEEQSPELTDRRQSSSDRSEAAVSANSEDTTYRQPENHVRRDRESRRSLHVSLERSTMLSRSREGAGVHGRTIHISAAEHALMAVIGTFRTLAVSDLAQ